MDASLWNAERSVHELAAIRDALGLRKVHLMGHSWGGAVVADYISTAKPTGVESVILAGPLLSTQLWIDDANLLRTQLPGEVQEVLRRNEEAGTVQSEEYEEATKVFYSRFLYHQADVQKPESCAQSPANYEIYQIMWGPTEFHATGNLSTFDVTSGLKQLTMPTMIIVGRYDEVRLETAVKFQGMIRGSAIKVLENSGHMAPLEEYEAYSAMLQEFLRKVDSRAAARHPPPRHHKTN
jgi:proline iminopeptidase